MQHCLVQGLEENAKKLLMPHRDGDLVTVGSIVQLVHAVLAHSFNVIGVLLLAHSCPLSSTERHCAPKIIVQYAAATRLAGLTIGTLQTE